jgi:hypothetical protein
LAFGKDSHTGLELKFISDAMVLIFTAAHAFAATR